MERISTDEFIRLADRIVGVPLRASGFARDFTQVVDDYVVNRYKSDAVFVDVVLLMPDYEPRIRVGLAGRHENKGVEPFDLYEVLELTGRSDFHKGAMKQTAALMLDSLARNLFAHRNEVLDGNTDFFMRLEKRRAERKQEFQIEEKDRYLRSQADMLWNAGDRPGAAGLYAQLSRPSAIERKKMEMAGKLSTAR